MKMTDLVVNKQPQKQKKMKIIITENQAKMLVEKMKIDHFKLKELNINETNQR
jgi:hypothetical protein